MKILRIVGGREVSETLMSRPEFIKDIVPLDFYQYKIGSLNGIDCYLDLRCPPDYYFCPIDFESSSGVSSY